MCVCISKFWWSALLRLCLVCGHAARAGADFIALWRTLFPGGSVSATPHCPPLSLSAPLPILRKCASNRCTVRVLTLLPVLPLARGLPHPWSLAYLHSLPQKTSCACYFALSGHFFLLPFSQRAQFRCWYHVLPLWNSALPTMQLSSTIFLPLTHAPFCL